MKTALQKILFTVLFISISSSAVFTQWTDDPATNSVLMNVINTYKYDAILPNNSGGAIVTWNDVSNSSNPEHHVIYAQKLDANGKKLWTPEGVVIANLEFQGGGPVIVNDGAGGAIIMWQFSHEIYTQRIDSNGNIKWDINGTKISINPGYKGDSEIISDGSGGAIIIWRDYRIKNNRGDIYAQRINSSGELIWRQDGVPITYDHYFQMTPEIIYCGNGEAIIVWADDRNSPGEPNETYAQKIDLLGNIKWNPEGMLIFPVEYFNQFINVISDGAQGAIILERTHAADNTSSIHVQKINTDGILQWTSVGKTVFKLNEVSVSSPDIIADGMGGAYIVWSDTRNVIPIYDDPDSLYTLNIDLFAQKINSSGENEWNSTGIPVCNAASMQINPLLSSDGSGGIITHWIDYRPVSDKFTEDIYAQRISSSGLVKWQTNGIRLGPNSYIYIIHPNDKEEWVVGTKPKIIWKSKRFENKKVDIAVSTDSGTTWILIAQNEANDGEFNDWIVPNYPKAKCKIRISETNNSSVFTISDGFCTIVNPSVLTQPAGGETWIVGSSTVIRWKKDAIKCKAVNIDISTDAGTTWKILTRNTPNDGDWRVQKVPDYPSNNCKIRVSDVNNKLNSVVSALFTIERPVITIISPKGGENWRVGGDAVIRWESNCASKLVNIDLSTDAGLSWVNLRRNLPDDGDWHIYNIPNLPSTRCIIRITDKDGYATGENELFFNIIKSTGKLSADNAETVQLPTEFALDQNYPNPFNPVTVISYQLPVISHATLKIYDLLGKEVATLVNEEKAPGYYEIEFNAGNLSSGVYIYRLNAGSFTSTKKLLLMK